MKNIRNILIPVDFSEASNNSLAYAIQLAGRTEGTKIFVLHSFHVPVTTMETAYVADQAILMKQTEERARQEMQALEQEYLEPSGIPYECIVDLGPTMENINEAIETHGIDLVIMATHKASRLERMLGNLSAYAIEHSKAPLLLVPDKASFSPVRKLAFTTDLKIINRTDVFDKLKFLAESFGSHIIVLHVDTDEYELTEEEERELRILEQELQGFDYHVEQIKGEDEEEAILDYVKAQQVDMVAAVPRHHGFFEELFRDSVTKELALHTRVPLLAIHE
jgi:nucleotide-binding universal stress UspA family protein